ncbi:hypothetical protein niasHT_020954 [Heterodera trifolii]|uniref:WAP domain-containing protein n=1 Tax=Heterodera trifolii TaxID=157864 RepID=A0ABD2KDF0_9BILA
MGFSRLILITLISCCLLPLASVVLAQCPYQGWTVSGSCQIMGYCVDPRDKCYYRSSCCRISNQQYAQTTKQNPKTGLMETNYCPLGAYRDGGCSTMCWTPSQVCVNRQDCCVQSNIPVNSNPYGPTNTGPNTNYPGFNAYNPGISGGDTCRQGQGQCPLTMCQDGLLTLSIYGIINN